jgi:hypothetical protein
MFNSLRAVVAPAHLSRFLLACAVMLSDFQVLAKPRKLPPRAIDPTSPAVIPAGKIPPRDAKNAASYVGMPNDVLFMHLKDSRSMAVVGIKEPGAARGFFAGRSLVSKQTIANASRTLAGIDGVSMSKAEQRMPEMPDRLPYPALVLQINSQAALQRVRGLAFVDFVEPLYPEVLWAAGVGCGTPAYPGSASDLVRIVGGASNLTPWMYAHHAIQFAWGLFPPGTAPGAGVDFFMSDTGVYASQRQFWENFAPPTAAGRTFSEVLWGGTPRVSCSHGTRIAGLAAAPLDGSSAPGIVGIAWGSSMRSMKVGDGVVQFDTPITGLTGAIMEAASSSFALPLRKRVLLMAWGMPWESQLVRDTIVAAYDANPELIMVAAAGTGEPFVIFPATMRRETVSVSMVDAPNPASMAYGLIPITAGSDMVAYGDGVDFVAVNNVSRQLFVPTTGRGVNSAGLSVDGDGNLVPASGLPRADVAEITTLGGSSSAVSIIGGGIALTWSRMPTLTRDEVMDRVVAASSCARIAGLSAACRDANGQRVVGHGLPDFYVAAGGARRLWIDGPPQAGPGQPVALTAAMDGDPALFDFTWSTGTSGRTATITPQVGQVLDVTITAVNRSDNITLSASRRFVGGPATPRLLFANSTLQSFAVFLDGHRVSANINTGAALPAGCFITGVAGQELTIGGIAPGSPFGIPEASVDRRNRGFTITRSAFGPGELDVLARAWHDGLSAVRVRPVYFVLEPPGVDCNASGFTQTTP